MPAIWSGNTSKEFLEKNRLLASLPYKLPNLYGKLAIIMHDVAENCRCIFGTANYTDQKEK
jgi:hypothetical protein